MNEPTTNPSVYADLLEDTPAGNRAFKRYMVDSIAGVKGRLDVLEKTQPMIISSVNDSEEKKRQFEWTWTLFAKAFTGLAALGGTVYALWDVITHLFETGKHP